MIKTASLLQCCALTFGGALSLSYAECPTWDDLLAEESVLEVNIARRASMFISYVNPPQLGVCFLGESLYNQISDNESRQIGIGAVAIVMVALLGFRKRR